MSNWKKHLDGDMLPANNISNNQEDEKVKIVEKCLKSLDLDKEIIDQYNKLNDEIKKEAYVKIYKVWEMYKGNKNNLEIKVTQSVKILYAKQQKEITRKKLLKEKEDISRQSGSMKTATIDHQKQNKSLNSSNNPTRKRKKN